MNRFATPLLVRLLAVFLVLASWLSFSPRMLGQTANGTDKPQQDPRREQAGQLLAKTLKSPQKELSEEQKQQLFQQTAQRVLELLPAESYAAKVLQQGLASADNEGGVQALAEALQRAETNLNFRPLMEAKPPQGFPAFTPVGEVVVKEYPNYRMVRTLMANSQDSGAFFRLFRHIKKNSIAMTAPVQMDYTAEAAAQEPTQASMAFLYGKTSLGDVGKQGAVEVVDVPATQTATIGVRGPTTKKAVAQARTRLLQWLKENQHRYKSAGPMRVMGWNSPYVPSNRKYFEVEFPVEPIQGDQASQE